jgi:periplasmic divalent cation tolerance protein
MSQLVLVYTLCPSMIDAERIATTLLEKKLIACASIAADVISHYQLGSKHIRTTETPLYIHTTFDKYAGVEKTIADMNNNSTPCIVTLATEDSFPPYLEWVRSFVG